MMESAGFLMPPPPFYSQMVIDWEQDGFPSAEVAASWAPRGCGIACLRMLLDFSLQTHGRTLRDRYWDLIERGVAGGAYCEKGWIHNGLLKLASSYGLGGECHRGKDTSFVFNAIKRDSICIVSTSLAFRGSEYSNGQTIARGGHLILVYGIDMHDDGAEQLICHHPSSYPELNFREHRIDNEKFIQSFSGNFIEFYTPTELFLSRQAHLLSIDR